MSGQHPSPATLPLRKESLVSKPSLFWDVTRPRLVFGYRSFGKVIGPTSLKVGLTDSPETSVTNHQITPRRKTENSQHLVRREKWKYCPCREWNSDSLVDLPLAQSLYCRSYLGSCKRILNLTLPIFAIFYFVVLFNNGFIAKIM